MEVRTTTAKDIVELQKVLDETELFPSDMLPEMVGGFLAGEETEQVWLTCETDGRAVGFCFAAPEEMTDGTWNMLAIAVLPEQQGNGAGKALVTAMETTLVERSVRILIVDTSGTDEFAATREFYHKNDYTEEARIRDFWAAGDDKIVFRKAL